MKSNLILLGGMFSGAVAIPATGHSVHEKRDTDDARWIKREAVHADTKIPARIALKQRNLDKGMDYLMAVSDPTSEKYGQHYTRDQVAELFAPDESSLAAVNKWLTSSGVHPDSITVPRSRAWVNFDTTTGQLESLLKTRYHTYSHVSGRSEHIGTDEYSLPRDVSDIVEFITPGVAFAPKAVRGLVRRTDVSEDSLSMTTDMQDMSDELIQQLQADPEATSNCGSSITPACIRAMYGIPAASLHASTNQLGMFEVNSQKFDQSDLDKFYQTAASNIPAGTAPKANDIDGATATTNASKAGVEVMLDLEIAIPLIYPQSVLLYQTVVQKKDIFNTFLDAVDGSYCTSGGGDDPTIDGKTAKEQCGAFKPANVFTFSYGNDESDYPAAYMQRQCNEFMKLGLQGVSLFMASGDDGVARRAGPCLGPNQDIFTPDTAANCPYVTAVGATTLPSGSQPGANETAATSFSSGGGFSNVFTTPDYQKDAISSYFANHDPGYKFYTTSNGTIPTTGGIYNRAGRGYPDISAVGQNGAVVARGKQSTVGGTSMATPLIASIFNLINEERIKAGKSSVGFVNPTLYQHPEMFNDITVGNQDKGGPNGDGKPSACGNNGFSAVPGWDPVTGLGTPNYQAMLKVFLSI